MWRVTRDASVSLDRSMLVNERALFVSVTLDARGISAGREPRLFQLKSTVWVVTIATLHRAFQHLVMERQVELVLRLTMTTETELGFAVLEQFQIGEAGLLRVGL